MTKARRLLLGALALTGLLLSGPAPTAVRSATQPAVNATPDLANDPLNCGAVGFRVPPGDTCRFGVATPSP